MRGERLSLKSIALASMIFAIPYNTFAQENSPHSKIGVLNTVYNLILDNQGIGLRKCLKFKPSKRNPYDLCAIAQEAEIDGENIQFFAANPKGSKIEMKKGRTSIKDVRTLEIAVIFGNQPCFYRLHYTKDESGFNDKNTPYTIYPPLKKNEEGRIINEASKKCKQKLMTGGIWDLKKIKKLHKKTISSIKSIIEKNTLLLRAFSPNK